MDESKLSKSDANRKPLEFLLKVEPGAGGMVFVFDCAAFAQVKQDTIFREVLPSDDSIRVSREDWDNIQKIFLEFATAEKFLRAADIVERIERESRSEG